MNINPIFKPGAKHVILLLLPCLAVILSAGISSAATFVVTSCTDSNDPGSLRRAIFDANASWEESNTIIFEHACTTTLTLGEMTITKDLTIKGPGSNGMTINANNLSRVFNINDSIAVYISGMTIRNGHFAINGGGIANYGTLTVDDCAFADNNAGGEGGAIYTDGSFDPSASTLITRTTFSGNTAAGKGGAIQAAYGDVTVRDCTFFGNQGSDGGAIGTNDAGSVIVQNSTFYNNAGTATGGAIGAASEKTVSLLNCTFSANGAPSGGALQISAGATVNATNTIFANSTGSSNCNTAFTGTNSHNIDFGGPESLNTCGAGITGDPALAVLGYSGGRTYVMQPGSLGSAIDAADPFNFPATDQRGWPRPYGAAADIGAAERTFFAELDISKTGSGTVKSSPLGISCLSSATLCTSYFPVGSSVSLFALPSPTAIFSPGWSGAGCGSTVLMDTDETMTCTATFTECGLNPVKAEGTLYGSIMEAYAGGEHVIGVTATLQLGDIVLGTPGLDFEIYGGFNCDWTIQQDFTYINGIVQVTDGSLVLDQVVIL